MSICFVVHQCKKKVLAKLLYIQRKKKNKIFFEENGREGHGYGYAA